MTASFTAAFDLVRGHVAEGRLPSGVLGIATADGTVALDAVGTDAAARFPLFSITKPLVGLAAARAVERGLLTPETPLRDALPEFGRDRDDTVRLRHLVSHTSGISEPALDTPRPLRTELITAGRDFTAGTVSRYSSIAFEGIAALLEHATGRGWDDAVAEWANEIGADGLSLDHEGTVEVEGAAEAGLDMERFVALRHPGAGLAGRAEDLLRLGTELLRIERGGTDGILRPATLAMMRRPLTGDIPRLEPYPAERGQDWGFAWNLRSRAPGLIDRDVYGHGGWAGTEFWVHPTAGIAWVLLTARAPRDGVDLDALDNAVVSAR
ncbi:beta-lactamase family protein [Microbacterium sp. EYE_5]|uniref:serine hydrolase domain-containing protein n=1 Tax=unclassified Microbacterium TaxID=2609290 RepID=UPI002002A80E|nr:MULTISPECIES: serine hydrolase domain-containing protein [unclassified Microbacterium]MCK6079280.1 beta-lactamase family protein [Microbacterium sp. EYE_382]MCK6084550.1 beta-lactamase family protein [Microbacterium sp. EYE_384]MCK6123221.1 beta-lactamase family protein [Microbacterium sp. EYE_80]MCK6125314.1 beta-lactamase family protein [Microbacterium sp. EYE_79]MCK6140234.1 beta-lactamase family protein [Microbacterium sp. EYE_39]